MRAFAELLRVVFISPEFLAIVIVYLVYEYMPTPLETIGQRIVSSDWILNSILILPACFVYRVLAIIPKLRKPPDKEFQRGYCKWPDLWAMKLRLGVAKSWCILSITAVILVRLFWEEIELSVLASIVLAAHVVSFVCWLSCYAAHLDIDEHLINAADEE